MSPIPTRKHPYDDLTAIHGIGAVMQHWLRDMFDVRTYDDLARLTINEIEARMKEDGKIASRSKIAAWLAEAQALAAENATNAGAPPDSNPGAGHDGWQTAATFVIVFEQKQPDSAVPDAAAPDAAAPFRFRTKAHHMETDETNAWASIEVDSLGKWITAQLGVELMGAKPESASKPVPALSAAPERAASERAAPERAAPSLAAARAAFEAAKQSPVVKESAAAKPATDDPKNGPPHGAYSDALLRHLAKAQALSGSAGTQALPPTWEIPAPEGSMPLTTPEPETKFSSKMQERIAKARRLAADSHEPV